MEKKKRKRKEKLNGREKEEEKEEKGILNWKEEQAGAGVEKQNGRPQFRRSFPREHGALTLFFVWKLFATSPPTRYIFPQLRKLRENGGIFVQTKKMKGTDGNVEQEEEDARQNGTGVHRPTKCTFFCSSSRV
ncbi:hypothetical protein GPALN_014708 [Globodera pallida]|nr:hypothetical protein GPALN_014708 [Globodera pallida]